MKKKKIIIVTNSNYDFAWEDYNILSKSYETIFFVFDFKSLKAYLILLKYMYKTDVIICWLAHYFSFVVVVLNKLFFRKKIITIAGGDEVAYLPEYSYGALASKKRYFAVKHTFLNSDIIISVEERLADKISEIYKPSAPIFTVYTSYDPNDWRCFTEKEQIVLTVGNITLEKRFFIKGIDRIIEVAHKLPSVKFIIIGDNNGIINDFCETPSNVTIFGKLKRQALKEYYSKAKVFCQLSRSEGLPNVVCEAMLCECVPVCTDVGGMKMLCDKTGYVIKEEDLSSLSYILKDALRHEKSDLGRNFIVNNFSIKSREEKLIQIIESVFSK